MRIFIPPLVVFLALGMTSRSVVPPGTEVEKVATGYAFTEGPAADGNGNIYFTDIPNNRILRFEESTGRVHVFRESSGGANGLEIDQKGRLYACEGSERRVTVNDTETGSQTVVAARFEAKRFNGPNDLALDKHGGLYLTDPIFGPRDTLELDRAAVYYVNKKGEVMRVVEDLAAPNGVALSPNGMTLYVSDWEGKGVWRYTVRNDGSVRNGHILAWMNRAAEGGPDGLRVDKKGNVYAAGQGKIWVWNKDGEEIGSIPVPENPSSCAFGGKGSHTLYITAESSLYRITLDAEGVR